MINILEQLLKQEEERQAKFHKEMEKLEQRKAAFAEGVAVRHAELHEAIASLKKTLRETDNVQDEFDRANSQIEENNEALKKLLDEI